MENWKKTELETRNPLDAAFMEHMVASIPKRQKTVNTYKSKAQQLYDDRENNPEAYEAYLNRPMPSAECMFKDENGDPLINERKLDIQEAIGYEAYRRGSKNTLGDAVSMGDGKSASEDRKSIAISAFTCTPPADLTPIEKERITKLEEIQTVEKKLSFLDKLKQAAIGIVKRPKRTSKNKYGDIIYHYEDDTE